MEDDSIQAELMALPKTPWWRIYFGVIALIAFFFVIGLVGKTTKKKPKTAVTPMSQSAQQQLAPTSSSTSRAPFRYLAPKTDAAWNAALDAKYYDGATGALKYVVTLKQGNVLVAISQQNMPEKLKPRGSANFMAMINDAKITNSRDIGQDTLYFIPALMNGVPANGATTVIYATDSILLFGKSDSVVSFDNWEKLIKSLSTVTN